jgi:DNA-binding GntR family transcriptional regulator
MIVSLADQPNLTDRIYEGIRHAIFSLELEPGSPLVERDLAARFGVSKTPVRDALRRLAGEGIVNQSPYRGTTVRVIDPDEADEIYALREVLEAMAVRLATPNLALADIEAARQCLDQSRAAMEQGDRPLVARINRDFHAIFSQRSGNRALDETLSNLQDRVRLITIVGWRYRPSMREDLAQHHAVLDAAVAGDAEVAGELMRQHIECFRMAYRAGWGDAHHPG